jgi:hypothetical protein
MTGRKRIHAIELQYEPRGPEVAPAGGFGYGPALR